MKKFFSLIILILLPIVANAYDAEIDGIYYDFSGNNAEVTYVTFGGYSGPVVIPQSVTYNGKTYSVTSIGGCAFEGCFGLTSVTIPNSVISIGGRAFYYCRDLTAITIPNSVTSIGEPGEPAFEGCSGLTSIKVDVGNTKYDSRNNCNAIIETATNTLIAGCQNTVIPNSVTSIGDYAFSGCSGLISVTIPNNVTSIGYSAFSGCSGLTSVTIPNSVTSIGHYAFCGCRGLTSITIPNSVTSIEYNPFSSCSGLTSIKVATGNTKYDSRNSCNAIIETATNTLIAGCKNTVIPNNVTSIGEEAFFDCNGLTSINIPNSVIDIGVFAFYGCKGLTSVKIKKETPVSISEYTFSNRTNATLYVPYGCKGAYEAADYWKDFKEIIEIADEIYMESTECVTGRQMILPIALKNRHQFTGLQMDLYLPEGMTVATNSRGKLKVSVTGRMDGNYSLSCHAREDGFVRITGFSPDNDAFMGNDGDILNVTLDIAENMEDGNNIIQLKDIVLSDVNNTEYHPADARTTVNVCPLGDADGSGIVNINDVVCIVNHILNRATGKFIDEAADVDNSGTININDVVVLIDRHILHRNNASLRAPRLMAAATEISDRLYLADLDVMAGDIVEVSIQLSNVHDVRAVQGNVKLPEGFTFVTKSNGRLDVKNLNDRSEDFTLSCALQSDGSMTFTHYSIDGYPYEGSDGGIFTFKVAADSDVQAGTYNIALTNVVLSIDGKAYELPDFYSSILADGIRKVKSENATKNDCYDLQGRKLDSKPTQPGIYIQNGHKVVIK